MNLLKKTSSSYKRGFTLIELLVVIAIIAVFAAVVLSSVYASSVRGRNAKRSQNLDQILKATNIYFSTNGSLPVATGWCHTVSDGAFGTALATALQPYIKTIQGDPTLAGLTGDYLFSSINAGSGQFRVCTTMEAPNLGNGNSYNAGAAGCGGATAITYNYCLIQ